MLAFRATVDEPSVTNMTTFAQENSPLIDQSSTRHDIEEKLAPKVTIWKNIHNVEANPQILAETDTRSCERVESTSMKNLIQENADLKKFIAIEFLLKDGEDEVNTNNSQSRVSKK